MLSSSIRVLDFDDSIARQKRLLSSYKAEIIDFKSAGPAARFWVNSRDRDEIKRRIGKNGNNALTFIGSGDFHHISGVLIEGFDEKLSLISFDAHPDWHIFPPRFGCGSWVRNALRNKNILKCVLAGASSDDLDNRNIQTADLASLASDRMEVYPYSHAPTTVFFRNVPENISVGAERSLFSTKIYWNSLKGKDLAGFFTQVLRRLPVKKVYVTIDKDCLRGEYALTNWERGTLSLEELLLMLKLIKDNLDIAGADITGDYSEIRLRGRLKNFLSYIDHPKDFSAKGFPASRMSEINEETNLKITRALL